MYLNIVLDFCIFMYLLEMNRLLVLATGKAPKTLGQVAFFSSKLPASQQVPKPKEITPQNAQFDEVTHTGQVYYFLLIHEIDYICFRLGIKQTIDWLVLQIIKRRLILMLLPI